MPKSPTRELGTDYDKSIFINCPLDDVYLPLFPALIFGVFECGLVPRRAQPQAASIKRS